MKFKIFYNDKSFLDLDSSAHPVFEGNYVRFITLGTFMEAKEAVWLNTSSIDKITMVSE